MRLSKGALNKTGHNQATTPAGKRLQALLISQQGLASIASSGTWLPLASNLGDSADQLSF